MLALRIRRPDGARIRYRVEETRRRARDLRPGFEEAMERVRDEVRQWFETEGRGTWAGLALSTIRARANRWGYYRRGFREGPAHRVLHARHDLVRSLTRTGGKHVSRARGRRRWEFGTEDPKASYLHRGDRSGMNRFPRPARPLVPRDRLAPVVGKELLDHVLWAWRHGRDS